jgi:hypothetical protein
MQLVALVHAIPESHVLAAEPFGLGMIDHAEPFHRSTSVRTLDDGFVTETPTAKQRVEVGQVTSTS